MSAFFLISGITSQEGQVCGFARRGTVQAKAQGPERHLTDRGKQGKLPKWIPSPQPCVSENAANVKQITPLQKDPKQWDLGGYGGLHSVGYGLPISDLLSHSLDWEATGRPVASMDPRFV